MMFLRGQRTLSLRVRRTHRAAASRYRKQIINSYIMSRSRVIFRCRYDSNNYTLVYVYILYYIIAVHTTDRDPQAAVVAKTEYKQPIPPFTPKRLFAKSRPLIDIRASR